MTKSEVIRATDLEINLAQSLFWRTPKTALTKEETELLFYFVPAWVSDVRSIEDDLKKRLATIAKKNLDYLPEDLRFEAHCYIAVNR